MDQAVFGIERDSDQALPPARAPAALGGAEAMRLLRVYESVVALRPLLGGNRDFLESLLVACRQLASVVEARPDGLPGPFVSAVSQWVANQYSDNAAVAARELVKLIDAASPSSNGHARLLFARTLPELAESYDRITVVFGPGIGLGDEITFAQFLRALTTRYRSAKTRVFTLYPGLWRELLPNVHEQHYRRRPLRPFSQLSLAGDRTRELVVIADFELFGFSGELVRRRPARDILEISLGRREARLVVGMSPWTRFGQVDRPGDTNYEVVRTLAQQLLGDTSVERWRPVSSPRLRRGRRITMLLNPLSSKPLPYGADDWARMLEKVCEQLDRTGIRVLVHPGPEPGGAEFGRSICNRLRGRVDATLIVSADGQALSPFTAIPAFAAAARNADLCITLDTFAAHLAPLFLTPTVAIAYADNYHFWVPSPWVFYVLLEDSDTRVPDLASRLLRDANERPSPETRSAAARLSAATRRARREASADGVQSICAALAEMLTNMDATAPSYAEGAEWLRTWSRVGSAQRRDPVEREALQSYVDAWTASEFYKLATIFVNIRSSWGPA
jgi:hypothetical protein